jgi:protein phosphatase
MGGHAEGHIASQMVRDALAALEPEASLARGVDAVGAALSRVNDYLYSLSLRPVKPVVSGTTVVVLLVSGAKGVCLWAGDSRLYRLRSGSLEQLTDDHAEAAAEDTDSGAGSNVITRAVGGHARLELDHASFDVRPGDRFLLCSDGLYRELSAGDLREILESGDAISTVDELTNRTLLGEAADNVTAVIVDAQPEVA